jgi:hypothetical protein
MNTKISFAITKVTEQNKQFFIDHFTKENDINQYCAKIRRIFIYLRGLPNYIQYFKEDEDKALNNIISKYFNDAFIGEKERNMAKTLLVNSSKSNLLRDSKDSLLDLHFLIFESTVDKIDTVNNDLLIKFIFSKNKNFNDASGVCNEIISYLKGRTETNLKECETYFSSINDHLGNLLISVFVFVFPKINEQTHFFIVRSVSTDLKYFLSNTKSIGGLSLLLHSFSFDQFSSTRWYTSAIGQMIDVIGKASIKYKIYDNNKNKSDIDTIINQINLNNYDKCHPNKIAGMGTEHTYIFDDILMKNIWKDNKIIKPDTRKDEIGETRVFLTSPAIQTNISFDNEISEIKLMLFDITFGLRKSMNQLNELKDNQNKKI